MYKEFEIVIEPFPFIENTDKNKYRPALVLSKQKFNQETKSVILAMITTAKNSKSYADYEIKNYDNTGLRAKSVIRLKLFTLDYSLIEMKMGELQQTDIIEIKKVINNELAI